MAPLLIVLAAISLAVLSQVFGHDSRDTMYSKEQELATHGMTWELTDSDQELADQWRQALQRKPVRLAEPARDEVLVPSGTPSEERPTIQGSVPTLQEA